MARQAPGSHTLTLQTGLLAPHQPSEVAPQQASCTLVKPEVTSTSRNPPVPEANFSPKRRRKGVKGVRCMELCITVRSLLPSRPKTGESGSRREPSLRTLHARPDLLYALPLRRPSSATPGHRRNPPARTAVHRPRRRRLSLLTPRGGRFKTRVRVSGPATATNAVAASGRESPSGNVVLLPGCEGAFKP